MKLVIVYATREGQTRKIAEHVAATVRARNFDVDVVDAREVDGDLPLQAYAGAILAASVHLGKHEREMVAFVKRHRQALAALPCAFLSVSGAEATAEHDSTPAEARARAAIDVRQALDRFFRDTGWTPARFQPVAGAFLFTHYNFLVRFVMRRIVKRSGVTTDLTGDHEYTDWTALAAFVDSFLALFGSQPLAAHVPL